MSLASGTRLGPYEVTAPLGAGGMGEVYRATDTNLKRQVAIKVRRDGTVKVLDSGLAKAHEQAGASSADMMNSPTLTARATQMGMILGTADNWTEELKRLVPTK